MHIRILMPVIMRVLILIDFNTLRSLMREKLERHKYTFSYFLDYKSNKFNIKYRKSKKILSTKLPAAVNRRIFRREAQLPWSH